MATSVHGYQSSWWRKKDLTVRDLLATLPTPTLPTISDSIEEADADIYCEADQEIMRSRNAYEVRYTEISLVEYYYNLSALLILL